MSSEVGRAITIHLGSESARVGLAAGYKVVKFGNQPAEKWADAKRRETWEELDKMLTPTSGSRRNWRASMAQDVTKGRPTEIDYMNGHVVAEGRERGIATPVSAATVEMIHEIESGKRKPEAQNIELVLKRAGV
jgi:2-dehydropantoate 2-reductase